MSNLLDIQANMKELISKENNMGLNYKGNTDHHHSISENLRSITTKYSLSNGYFGTKGNSGDASVRHIKSSNPSCTAKDFYDTIAKGGIESNIYDSNGNIKGGITKMADGTIVTWRNVSNSDGSPAIDINIQESNNPAGIKGQKIHFVKG